MRVALSGNDKMTLTNRTAICIATLVAIVTASTAVAHHSVPGEFGPSSRQTIYIEGKVVKVMWRNPHVFINFQTTGGDTEAGKNWRLTTHPIHILRDTYDFHKEQFAVGDTIQMHGWTHLRGQPMFHPRALQINDGPMRSLLRFADARDIVAGTFAAKGIVPTKSFDGSDPSRAGKETVEGLRKLGFLDDDDLIELPDDFKNKHGLDD
jgi:hypothetical protein